MALKLIPLDEAARTLGITVERLNQLRERQQIYGYRDGASWKFKQQDLERLADDLRAQTVDMPIEEIESSSGFGLADEDSDDLGISLEDSDSVELSLSSDTTIQPAGGPSLTESEDVVLVSDREFGASEPGTSSTIIGKPGKQSPEESDIRLVGPSDRRGPGESDVKLKVDRTASESGLRLVVEQPVEVAPDAPTDLRLADDELSLDALSDSSDEVAIAAPPGAGARKPPGQPKHDSAELDLADSSSDDEFAIAGIGQGAPSAADSGITLGSHDLDDDDLVLSSAGGSDVTLGSAADSGISLASPSDSGLSLEEPLELKSSEDESLELGGDEFAIAADSDSDSADIAPADDDFLLTPIEDLGDSESEDSGSQVIALDSDSGFGDSGLLEGDAGGMLEEDFGAADGGGALGAGLGGTPALAAGGVALPGLAPREAPYTMWNIVSLVACAMLLSLTGMMMFDLIRNMWSWESPYGFNSWLMDTVLGLFGSS
ncbi:MAG: helix-turn-helix domain-containing protein [Planctomycetaceae bacterium]|nr:helix-turn-helix domain-containing protein [Planctomycetaceae bacterium]